MDNQNIKKRLDGIDQIRDKISAISSEEHPFLHYLPEILLRSEFAEVNISNVLLFVSFVVNNKHSPVIYDALKVLDQLVNKIDGKIFPPSPKIFYNNNTFLWKELGNHVQASDVMMHIINKTVFLLSLENRKDKLTGTP